MRRLWAKIIGLTTMATLLLTKHCLGGRAGGGPPGHGGRHPEVHRLGGLVGQPLQ